MVHITNWSEFISSLAAAGFTFATNVPLLKGAVFNRSVAQTTPILSTILGAGISTPNSSRIFRIYAAFTETVAVDVRRTRTGPTTITEHLNSGSILVAGAAYMWDILTTSLDTNIDFWHTSGPAISNVLGFIVQEVF